MYSNFNYFGASNGPTAWPSFANKTTDTFSTNGAIRGGILANDKKIDSNSKYCKTIKCNGISIVYINTPSSSLWLLMATNINYSGKAFLYDLKRKHMMLNIMQNRVTFMNLM